MVKDPVEQLNDGQKQCLRLVLGHLNSKEISRELGISPHTVDQRLRTAMRALNSSSRFEAARKFAELENEDTYQPLIYQSPDVANSGDPAILGGPAKQEMDEQDLISNMTNTGKAPAAFSSEHSRLGKIAFPVPRHRGEKNELSTVARLGWIIIIAIGSAVSFGGILAGLEALSRLNGR